jgi:threonine dehydrogenase-like Zn-dependent dehydrogenase
MKITGGTGCDSVIEATGAADPLNLAGELTRTRGRLVIAGYHQDGLRCVNMQLWNWRGLDVINAHEREDAACLTGMRAAVATSACGNLNLSPLYTHTFPLQELPTAMQLLAERPQGFLKSLIIMEQNSFY